MTRRRQSSSTCHSSAQATARCPAGAAAGAGQPRRGQPQGRPDHPIAARRHLDLSQARRGRGRGDLRRGHGRAPAQPEHPQLSQPGQQLAGLPRPAPGSDVGHGHDAARPQHPVALLEEGPPGAEMERRLHADDPVGSPIGDGQPRRVTHHWRGASCRQPSPPGGQLPLGDVHRHQPPRADQLRDQPILNTEPVTGIHDDAPGRKRGRQRRHQPTACGLGLILRTGPVPQPQVQPARRRREEEFRSNALVDARGRIPALPDHLGGMPHMLTRPAEHVLPTGRRFPGPDDACGRPVTHHSRRRRHQAGLSSSRPGREDALLAVWSSGKHARAR